VRAAQAAAAAAATQARKAHAQRLAGEAILRHGFRAVVEDASLAAWARAWGRAQAAFAPGTILAALRRESETVAGRAKLPGGVLRASTRTTALSQHCLCGTRVPKTLAARTHRCAACGLVGDRDAVSAALGSFVVFGNPTDPATARVKFDVARVAIDAAEVLRETLNWAAKGGKTPCPSQPQLPPPPDRSSGRRSGRHGCL